MSATLDRRGRLVEFLVVLSLTWLPIVGANVLSLNLPDLRSLKSELYGLLWNVGMIALILFVVWRNGESFRRLALRRTRWWAEILWAFLIYCADWLVVIGILFILSPSVDGPPVAPPSGVYGVLLPIFLLVSAATEELLFRGYLWDRIQRWGRRGWLTLLLTALMFTVMHPYDLQGLLFIFEAGLVLGFFRMWGRSLPRLIMAHFAFNLAVTYQWR